MQKCHGISEFVSFGFFKLDHDGSKILGYRDAGKCGIDGNGLYVEGTLLKGVPEAESIYRTAVALKKSNAPRRLGFSVEGQVLERDGNGLITKARVYNVAITAQPVNPNCTWDALCKSFVSDGVVLPEDGGSAVDFAGIAGADTYAAQETEKALSAEGSGAPLIPESLESALRNLAYIIGQDGEIAEEDARTLRKILESREDIGVNEAALYLTLTRGLTLRDSVSLVRSKL